MLDAAANAYKNRFTDIQLKAMEFAQLNVNAGFAFARKFFAVKEPAEVFTLQQTFVKEQAESFQRQAAELNELSVALAKESLKPVQDGMTKSLPVSPRPQPDLKSRAAAGAIPPDPAAAVCRRPALSNAGLFAVLNSVATAARNATRRRVCSCSSVG